MTELIIKGNGMNREEISELKKFIRKSNRKRKVKGQSRIAYSYKIGEE